MTSYRASLAKDGDPDSIGSKTSNDPTPHLETAVVCVKWRKNSVNIALTLR